MASHREFTRTKCESQPILMNLSGRTYSALLEDISIGGALIMVKDGIPRNLLDGDVCSFVFSHDDTSLIHTCRVIRHDSVEMGVCFLT
jgi:c-di-GMP-binding flagellar brake protein YcgR